jgi:hypothetical protein
MTTEGDSVGNQDPDKQDDQDQDDDFGSNGNEDQSQSIDWQILSPRFHPGPDFILATDTFLCHTQTSNRTGSEFFRRESDIWCSYFQLISSHKNKFK